MTILAHACYDCGALAVAAFLDRTSSEGPPARIRPRESPPMKKRSDPMLVLLAVSRFIDRVNGYVGRAVSWLVLAAVLISAGNAVTRYALNLSSNAWLEIQWYLFSAIFLLAAGWALLRNAHVRIDAITGRLTPRARAWIDIVGGALFLMPMALLILYFSWSMFLQSYIGHEMSSDAGGLVRWPVKLLIPVGFALLVLQGVSEMIKRIAFLRGLPMEEKPAGH
jgi:TRAP-type mannitol/chloroaromatic compound transport system permease small subunit